MSSNFLLAHFSNYMTDFLGGPRLLPARFFINFQKGATFFFMLFLMNYYQNYSLGSLLYLILHGSYGFLWILKDITFGDKSFSHKCTISSTIAIFLCLVLYWLIPFIQVTVGVREPTTSRIFTALFLYIFGVNIMLISDAQKFYTLKYRRGLIHEGMFKYTRNPNYLGEIMLYSSFAVLTGDIRAWLILFAVWGTAFNLNMYLKDEGSLKKKEGWEEYSRRSCRLLIRVFKNDVMNYGFYGGVACISYYIYNLC